MRGTSPRSGSCLQFKELIGPFPVPIESPEFLYSRKDPGPFQSIHVIVIGSILRFMRILQDRNILGHPDHGGFDSGIPFPVPFEIVVENDHAPDRPSGHTPI